MAVQDAQLDGVDEDPHRSPPPPPHVATLGSLPRTPPGERSQARKLVHGIIRDLLPLSQDIDELPVVDADSTVLEVAAVMARRGGAVVDDRDDGAQAIGSVTVSHLPDYLLSARLQP